MKEVLSRLSGPNEGEPAREGAGERDLAHMRRRLDELKAKTQEK